MRRFIILGAVALALAGCQGGRHGHYDGGYGYEYGPRYGQARGDWRRQQQRADRPGWHRQNPSPEYVEWRLRQGERPITFGIGDP